MAEARLRAAGSRNADVGSYMRLPWRGWQESLTGAQEVPPAMPVGPHFLTNRDVGERPPKRPTTNAALPRADNDDVLFSLSQA